ncbi:hypothetical protein QQX98_004702 [Neonectria punicea]|uniref:DUF521 domain protein n=1 Tax=Neonectria punicea TaxID=979145 RepID=A0ABR1H818_9HYPO
MPDDSFSFEGRAYVQGKASGDLMASSLELSFWGGVNPQTGEIIDRHHTLSGRYLRDMILAIPGGRGSCSGSGVLLELLLNEKGPKAMVFQRREDILTLGVMTAEELFGKAIPVLTLDTADFDLILKYDGRQINIKGPNLSSHDIQDTEKYMLRKTAKQPAALTGNVTLTELDQELIDGVHGEAARASIRIVLRMADLLGSTELIDISQVHIDGCIYTGPGSLAVAERLRDSGGRVRVPTSMNSISIDQRRWRAQGVDMAFGNAALKLTEAYTDMGATPTFTCAPYQLDSAPRLGDQVAWAESNAVVYANSVLGARTMKYPDFLDIAIALTGRAPRGGPHIDMNRLASLVVSLPDLSSHTIDDSFYPLLGYHIGTLASSHIPVVVGLESLAPSKDELKAFGAAFATVSSAPMFHIAGVTPEATSLEAVVAQNQPVRTVKVRLKDLGSCWDSLNSRVRHQRIDLLSLGTPHFSFREIRKLAEMCRGRTKLQHTAIKVTCGRATLGLASQAGLVEELERFGVEFITDTCWCMITDPMISPSAKAIITNSGKYAHYGPGLTGRDFYFASLSGCIDVACGSSPEDVKPLWLIDAIYKA